MIKFNAFDLSCMLSFKLPKMLVIRWLNLTLANGPFTKHVDVLFCLVEVLLSHCSCILSRIDVGFDTTSFRICNSRSSGLVAYWHTPWVGCLQFQWDCLRFFESLQNDLQYTVHHLSPHLLITILFWFWECTPCRLCLM